MSQKVSGWSFLYASTACVISVSDTHLVTVLLGGREHKYLNAVIDSICLFTLVSGLTGSLWVLSLIHIYIFARTLLAEVLVYINFLYDTPLLTQVPSEEQISAYYPVIDYINEHITEKISLDLLAQNFYVSKYYLSHRFKDLTGMTITDYIIRRRLTLAKSYLRQGLSVMLAGERAGFNSNNHFIHTFTKTVGM